MRRLRSLLFVPGDSERKLARAGDCGADALLLDLEDSVAPGGKEKARRTVADYLDERQRQRSHRSGADQYLAVRINPIQSATALADLRTVLPARPDAILLPKARGGGDVETLDKIITAHEAEQGGATDTTQILALTTEVPLSLLRMESYVGASSRLAALTWGAEDLSVALGAASNRGADGRYRSAYRLARDLCLLTARAGEVLAIDTVFTSFRDIKGLREEAEAAALDGFDGKMAIHPDQVAPINEIFTPSRSQIAQAEAVLAAFAANRDGGVVAIEGQMLDEPHRLSAQRLLARARDVEE